MQHVHNTPAPFPVGIHRSYFKYPCAELSLQRLLLHVSVLVCSGDHTIKLHSWPAGKPAQVLQDSGHTRTPWTVSD
jgi:hypothetical protein